MHQLPQHYLLWLLVGLTSSTAAFGQSRSRRFREGEEVQYQSGNSWREGVVLQVQGKKVGVEYFLGNQTRQVVVDSGSDKLRYPWEEKVISPMRLWSDESKQFSVRAAVMAFKGKDVLLYKEEDGAELAVPIDKLSESDQTFLKMLKSKVGPEIAWLPDLTVFQQNATAFGAAVWNEAQDLSEIPPDAPPGFASMPMKGVAFPKAHFFESLVRLEPIGGADGWMVAGTMDSHGDQPSRVLWAALAQEKINRLQLLPSGERVAAVAPRNRSLLTTNKEGTRLTLWTADPTLEVPEARVSWKSEVERMHGSQGTLAVIVAPNRVLHQWGKQKFVVWDTDAHRELYRVEQESFFGAQLVLSPGKKYFALPEDERVRIIEAATGNTLAALPVEGGRTAGVGFNADGTRLAVLTRSQLAIWEVGSSLPPTRLRADGIGTPFSATVEWVDDTTLLIDREVLYDTRHQLPVWNYRIDTSQVQTDSWGAKTQTVMGDKLCYAVNIRGQQAQFVIGAVELPGPGVREAVEGLDPESLYIIRPGHAVGLSIQCGEYDTEVRNALMQQIEDNDWVYDANSTTILKAEMGRSKPQTVTYRSMIGRGGGEHSISVTPYFSKLEVMYGDVVAWQTGGGSGLPQTMFLKDGESAQQKADSMQKPMPQLFSTTDIPEKLFDPAKKKGIGSSVLGARGLVPQ
ncbi:SHD1 domain-containing protein [Aureliella helgolandensis]|uniref:SLA1 homology domain-containing protein n=1 Tax=Aureliella helgolandensis TaxID=2527968 RepID=A0A518G4I3_9BACT|nr:SHD1 domain-containing protein [Aureliella helgolandensis]QDV23498.1 hypothetical protein Q31a_17970 [Aureliella helgolandensis]